jgi:hypothetical protein
MQTVTSMSRHEVRVDPNRRGGWDVALPDSGEHLSCDTLNEARRVASGLAADHHPCQLIVYDAYHRVLHRELIDGDER